MADNMQTNVSRKFPNEKMSEVESFPSLFNLPTTIVDLLNSAAEERKQDNLQNHIVVNSSESSKGLTCKVCCCTFETRSEQSNHFQSQSHLEKVRISPDNLACGTIQSGNCQEKFTITQEDQEDAWIVTGLPVCRIRCGEHILSFWKPIVCGAKDKIEQINVASRLVYAHRNPRWAVILLSSGRFAAACFEENRVLCHKTFSRYTIRKKAGGAQSTKDSSGRAPKSAGASLRRSNEVALNDDIRRLFETEIWTENLQNCSLVFISVDSRAKRNLMVGPLQKDDSRIRSIPFITYKPTLKEALRIHSKLQTIRILENEDNHTNEIDAHFEADTQSLDSASIIHDYIGYIEESDSEEESTQQKECFPTEVHITIPQPDLIRNVSNETQQDLDEINERLQNLQRLCQESKLEDILQEIYRIEELLHIDAVDATSGKTALHFAAEAGNGDAVIALLERGADPTQRTFNGRLPYQFADKATKIAFRRYRGEHPDAWDYSISAIPSGITEEMLAEKKEKNKEKRKKNKEKKKKTQETQETKEQVDTTKTLDPESSTSAKKISIGLSGVCKGLCSQCQRSVYGPNFIEWREFLYCGMNCCQEHKRELALRAAISRMSS